MNVYDIARLVSGSFNDVTVTTTSLDVIDEYCVYHSVKISHIFLKKRPIRAAEVKSGKNTDTQESLFLF